MTLMPDSSDNSSTANANARASLAGRLLSDPPGVTLKKAREVRRLDLETVADQLNLSPMVLLALEDDDYERLPGPTFVRGYIRCYARLLKLSGDDLVRNYDRMTTVKEPILDAKGEVAPPPAKKGKKGWVILAILGIVLLAVGFAFYSYNDKAEHEPAGEQPASVSKEKFKRFVEVTATEAEVMAKVLEPLRHKEIILGREPCLFDFFYTLFVLFFLFFYI